jgi:hypothetical protein
MKDLFFNFDFLSAPRKLGLAISEVDGKVFRNRLDLNFDTGLHEDPPVAGYLHFYLGSSSYLVHVNKVTTLFSDVRSCDVALREDSIALHEVRHRLQYYIPRDFVFEACATKVLFPALHRTVGDVIPKDFDYNTGQWSVEAVEFDAYMRQIAYALLVERLGMDACFANVLKFVKFQKADMFPLFEHVERMLSDRQQGI